MRCGNRAKAARKLSTVEPRSLVQSQSWRKVKDRPNIQGMQFSDLDRLNCLPGRKIRHLLLRLGSLMPKEGKALPKFAQVVAARLCRKKAQPGPRRPSPPLIHGSQRFTYAPTREGT